jgi:4-hydroxy-2-oxoheptanedioate aldolase
MVFRRSKRFYEALIGADSISSHNVIVLVCLYQANSCKKPAKETKLICAGVKAPVCPQIPDLQQEQPLIMVSCAPPVSMVLISAIGRHIMQAPKNTVKAAILSGQPQLGIWLNTGSSVVAEMVGQAGFDWCLIDGEHGPNTVTEWLPQLQALKAAGTPPVIRIPNPDVWMVKQVLDLGCQTVMVPMVDTPEQATEMAAAMRYAPVGKRGMGAAITRASDYGVRTDYLKTANDEVCLIVQAETQLALDNIEQIAAVDGVDCIFIGPADLAADMGYPGEAEHPAVVAAIEDGFKRITAAGVCAGYLTFDTGSVDHYTGLGVTFLGVGSDMAVMGAAVRTLAKAVR